MRILGISALVFTLISLICWFVNWVLITFFYTMYIPGHPLRYVGLTLSFLSTIAEFLAIGLLSIGLIIAAKASIKMGASE